ncbi:Putative uncharacterized protein [Pseudomonas aeruginosa]|nr:Putative uncharacterized protein [Pseudomonas aeruginosa]
MERNGTIRDSLDELADTRIVGFLEDVRRPVAKYPAVADDIDVVGDAGGLGQVMGNHDAGDAEGIVEQADQAHQDAHGDRILPHERLVVEQDLRVQGDRPGQGDAALHAAGKLVRHQFHGAAQADGLKLHQDDVADHLFRQLGMHTQRKRDVLEDVEIGEQRPALEQHAELLAHVEQVAARKLRQVLPVDPDLPLRRTQLGGDQPQQRGLAATGRAHDAGHLSARDTHIDVVENRPRSALEGQALQLDRVGTIGAHQDSLRCDPSMLDALPRCKGTHPGGVEWARTIALRRVLAQGLAPCRSAWIQLVRSVLSAL